MPNHYHLMVETPAGNLSRAMRHLDGVYTQGFNSRKDRVGPLFQGRYKAILIDQDAYSLEVSRYVHLNPVVAKLVRRPEDHKYSSLPHYLSGGKPPVFLETAWLLGQFHRQAGVARRAFHRFTMNGLKDRWRPEAELRGGLILGSEAFFEKIRSQYLEGREDREIPQLRKSRRSPDPAAIEACLERYRQDPRLSKRLRVWALKRYTPLTLKQIAERVGCAVSYSGISQTCRRLEQECLENEELRRLMTRLEVEMSNVKT